MFKSILVTLTLLASSEAFAPSHTVAPSSTALKMGFFDDIKYLLSDEAKEAARKRKEEEAEEQLRLQQEIYERRNNPEKMEEYDAAKIERRMKYKNQKREWELREEKVGEDGVWIDEEKK